MYDEYEVDWQNETPDMIIGSKNIVRGNIKFEGLLRIDGTIDGRIIAPLDSRIVISPGGCFIGDLSGFNSVYIDGKVVGDVIVENLYLGSSASVHGDISCKTIQIDGGAALVGKLEISPHALVTSDYDENKSIIEGDIEMEEEFPITDEEVASPRGELFQEDENDQDSYHSPAKPAPRREYRVVLFIMEPQVDFYPGGKCGARGGSNDTEKAEILADFIHSHLDDIDEIVVSLDSHNRIHVAHKAFWEDKSGNSPSINTLITMQDLQTGLWRPRKEESMDYCIAILQQLEANQQLYGHRSTGGEGGIVIKPDHCLVGSAGAAILPVLHDAVGEWGAHSLRNVTYLTRDLTHEGGGHQHLNNAGGHHHHHGHSHNHVQGHGRHRTVDGSAAAGDEVQVVGGDSPHKAKDYYDLSFLAQLNEEDKLLICGQSHSLCVEFSLKDVLSAVASTANIHPENISILKDATSTAAITNFGDNSMHEEEEENGPNTSRTEQLVEDFWTALARTGVQISSTEETLL
uniref:Uncharacterized protein n=1 Tax=Spumella elongata TaxID=89044 RepID=A0A7S3HKF8_9STRA|mmetsp:Transcript_56438/g.99137  ORF Transcript_56438/g.99137 Transcript_56438/m.99137 type:complete len:517 (+) Transcript_56438:74-1624(+)